MLHLVTIKCSYLFNFFSADLENSFDKCLNVFMFWIAIKFSGKVFQIDGPAIMGRMFDTSSSFHLK